MPSGSLRVKILRNHDFGVGERKIIILIVAIKKVTNSILVHVGHITNVIIKIVVSIYEHQCLLLKNDWLDT